MRDVGRPGRGLRACWTFVAYLVRWSEERSSFRADFVKMSPVLRNIAFVNGVLVYHSVLLAQCVRTTMTAKKKLKKVLS
jgi:hypothetical protein